jgi:hypothetical protein
VHAEDTGRDKKSLFDLFITFLISYYYNIIMVSSLINNSISRLQLIMTRATGLAVVVVSTLIKARREPRLASVPLPQCGIRPWDTIPADGVLGNRVGDTLSIEQIRIVVKVVDIIALLVVASI